MQIQVLAYWQDVKGRSVHPGIYADSDLPSGLASYLVNNGHAILLESEDDEPSTLEMVSEEEAQESETDTPSIPEPTKADLQATLEDAGIEYDKRWGKAKLLELLDSG